MLAPTNDAYIQVGLLCTQRNQQTTSEHIDYGISLLGLVTNMGSAAASTARQNADEYCVESNKVFHQLGQ
jgi:hypothetical protein